MVHQQDAEEAHHAETEFKIFREDIVSCPRDPALLGVVESVGGQSDSEDDEYADYLQKGQARVSWYKKLDNPSLEDVAELTVVDRALMHHDIVALRSDPLGQTGFITDVELFCDVRFVKSKRLQPMVNSRSLVPIQPLKQGVYVVKGPWLGKVDDCLDHVMVKFADGSMCRVANASPDTLQPHTEEDMVHDDCPYYPGVRVTGNSAVFKCAKWLVGSYKPRNHEGLVVAICPGRSIVRWVGESQNVPPGAHEPPEEVDGSSLQILSAFAHTWWQLGDYGLYTGEAHVTEASRAHVTEASKAHVTEGASKGLERDHAPAKPSDAETEARATAPSNTQGEGGSAAHAQAHASEPHHRSRQPPAGLRLFRHHDYKKACKDNNKKCADVPDDVDRCVEVVGTCTRVTVLWQDGSFSGPIPTTELIPVKHLDAHEFWPWEFVTEKLDEDTAPSRTPVPPSLHTNAGNGPTGFTNGEAASTNAVVEPEQSTASRASTNGAAPQANAAAQEFTNDVQQVFNAAQQLANGAQTAETQPFGLFPTWFLNMPAQASYFMMTPAQQRDFEEYSLQLERSIAPQQMREVHDLLCSHPLFNSLLTASSQEDLRRRFLALQASGFGHHQARAQLEELCSSNPALQQVVQQVLDWVRRSGLPLDGTPHLRTADYAQRFGVILSVDSTERVANIEWLGYCSGERELVGAEAHMLEQQLAREGTPKPLGKFEVSCYELLEHPYYSYSAGDVVIRFDRKKVPNPLGGSLGETAPHAHNAGGLSHGDLHAGGEGEGSVGGGGGR